VIGRDDILAALEQELDDVLAAAPEEFSETAVKAVRDEALGHANYVLRRSRSRNCRALPDMPAFWRTCWPRRGCGCMRGEVDLEQRSTSRSVPSTLTTRPASTH
jgi:hypothetical protein